MIPGSIRAIAWDIDGTLVDSEPLHEEVLFEVCAQYGETLSDIPHDHFKGVHILDVWDALAPRFAGRVGRDVWMETSIDRYVARAPELVALPQAIEIMRMFRAAGIRQVCVSNSGRRVVDANLAAIGAADLIEFSISLDDVERGKPDPFPYAEAARRLGLPPAEIAAVEDSPTGARSALLAGLCVFGIDPMGGSIEGAVHTVTRLSDLAAFILKDAA